MHSYYTMEHNHGALAAIRVLHYATPLCVLTSLTLARIAAKCLLHEPSTKGTSKRMRYTAIALLATITATEIAQAVSYFAESLIHHGRWAPQNCVFYILVSIFVYGSTAISLAENSKPLWYPILGAGFVAAILEVSLAALQTVVEPPDDQFAFSRNALHMARCSVLVGSCAFGLLTALQSRRIRRSEKGNEVAPLLANGHSGANGVNGEPTKPGYGSVPENDDDSESCVSMDSEDSEDPQQVKELKAQQQKRLKEAGNYFEYLKGFSVFVPMLLPGKKHRLIQLCLAIVGLVLIATRFLNVLVPRQLGLIINDLTNSQHDGSFPWRTAGLWALYTWLNSGAGVEVVKSFAELPVEQFARKQISSTAFAHVMNLDMAFHSNKNSGELIRAIDQGHALQGFLEFVCFEVLPMFIDLFVAFWYVSSLFDITMSYILAVVAVSYIWVGAKTNSWALKARTRRNTAWRNESKVQNEAINNWQTVSHFNRAQYECKRYNETLDEVNSAEFNYYYAYYTGSGLQSLIMLLGRLSATFLAIYRVSQGEVPLGNFVTLTAYWGSIQSPLIRASWSIRRVTTMLTDSERLLQLLSTKAGVADAPRAVEIHVDQGYVEFEHVEFAYDPRKPTLKDVSFAAKPGQTIALVGETGGGKSTVMKLLYRYYDITGGVIRIDGQDIRAVTLDSLRESFGMVPQDPALFNISILENVRYARLNASDEEVMEACKAAAIHEKILTFPDGYQSTVGERGVKLSGGELQRVSIARAILRQPKIVLLDEATSMIDAETEGLIQEAFKRLTASRTTFVIAHRLATIQHADKICVIHDGEIVESGGHDELFRKRGRYFALWKKQLSKDVQEVEEKLDTAVEDRDLIDMGEGDEREDRP